MSNAYIFYGKAGSGKGTQAALLKQELESQGKKVLYIETGNLFRGFVSSNDSYAATRTREIIDAGDLMPPFFPIYLWAHELIQNYDGTQDVIFDGAARRVEETQILASALSFFKFEKISVLEIDIVDDTAVARITSRNQGRVDDSDESKVREKMIWYRDNVMPAIEFWKKHPDVSVVQIDGEPDVEQVFEQIKNKV
jgi:adenylate kinase